MTPTDAYARLDLLVGLLPNWVAVGMSILGSLVPDEAGDPWHLPRT